VWCACPPGGGNKTTGKVVAVKVVSSAGTLVSGGSATITASVTIDGQPYPDATVTFTASACGTLSPGSATTPNLNAILNGTSPDVTTTFSGDSPTSTCTATITATVKGVTNTCSVTVTPVPVTVVVTGATVGVPPTVTIVPDVMSIKPYSAKYAITPSSGDTIFSINVDVSNPSAFAHSSAGTIRPAASGVTTVTISEGSNTLTDTVTIKSDSATLGTSVFDVLVNDTSSPGHVLHAKFPALPGPK
jgi:hypothetical protein